MFAREFAETLEKTWLRKNDAHVGGNGFDNDGGDLVFMLDKKIFYRGEIVVRNVEGELCEGLGNAGAFGDTESGEARAGLR